MSMIPNQQPYGNPYQPPVPVGTPNPSYPQPVVYRPGQPGMVPVPGMPQDSYRPGMPPTGPGVRPVGAPGQAPKQEYQYIAQKDVAFGILGAAGGFFLAPMIGLTGPIGALILGIALLGISAASRAIQHSKAQKQQQQQPGGMPQAPQYPNPAQQPQFQNRYDYNMAPQQQDPRYRYPQ